MHNQTIRYIIISALCLLTLLAQSTGADTLTNTVAFQDSIQIQFENDIINADDDSLQVLKVVFGYAEYLDNEGETESAIKKYNTALRVAKNLNNDVEIASITNSLARTYWMSGNFNASIETYKMSLQAAERTQNSSAIAKTSMNLANNYNYLGDYEKAIKHALYALEIKETTPDLERICYHYISMGNIFRENNNDKKWEEYVLKAYKMKEVEGCASIGDIAKIYNSLGGIAVQREEFEKALLYYDTLMVVSKEANYMQGINTALSNSAGVYKQLNNFTKALELSSEAEKYFGDNPYDIIFSNNFKAEIFQLLGQYKEGLKLAEENIENEDILYYSTEKLKCLQLLYELNYNLSNYEAAFWWNDSSKIYENELRDEDIRQSFEELETKYETEKKEQQIELLTTENQLKNQRINAGVAIVGVLLIVIFLILYILSIRKKQAALAQNDLQQQVLRAQMNPHFIFNVLGSIQNFMMKNDMRKASDFLSQFASLTRATLNNSVAETISLSDEISMLRNYIELEKMRSHDTFNFEINFDDDFEIDFIQIPPMLIQPFIENSIKHGFKNIDKTGFLSLHITDKTDWIEFVIEDNGNGIQQKNDSAKKHQSMAMKIFEKRRKLIQQKHKKDFKFELQNLSDINTDQTGVRITISIPIL